MSLGSLLSRLLCPGLLLWGLLMLAGPAVAIAGGLEPPGPPGPTMKTLRELEPRIPIGEAPYDITSPGSYYLVGDLSSTSYGIHVGADDVTIDLMGYNLYGPGTISSTGIYCDGRENLVIRNGTIHGFGMGIFAATSVGYTVRDVRAVNNAQDGINIFGSGHHIEGCTASGNGWRGFYVGEKSIVVGNTAHDNGENGLVAWRACTVFDNTVYGNNTTGQAGAGGIYVWDDNLVKGNTASNNSLNNIVVAAQGNAIEENLVSQSLVGIVFAYSGNFYANNRSHANTTDFDGGAVQTDGGGNTAF